MSAVTGGSEENEKFWKYTPSGSIKMHIDNENARNNLNLEKNFTLILSL